MNIKDKEKEWFEEWFDSPYYHILYKDRDQIEADYFINNLITYLKPNKHSIFLDAACGNGRHSFYLQKKGFTVDGFDLSENNINLAKKQCSSSQLHFYINDIRVPIKLEYYDYAFNLFTSFGYFDGESDNQLAINSIAKSLKPNGVFVLDFMNCTKIVRNIEDNYVKQVDGINFNIVKRYTGGFIFKTIEFNDHGNDYHFEEKVKVIYLSDFISYFNNANLKIEATFGDYKLNPFDESNSDRLIIVARKQ